MSRRGTLWLTSINAPGLKPNGLASVLEASTGPGLRSKCHTRAGEVIAAAAAAVGRCVAPLCGSLRGTPADYVNRPTVHPSPPTVPHTLSALRCAQTQIGSPDHSSPTLSVSYRPRVCIEYKRGGVGRCIQRTWLIVELLVDHPAQAVMSTADLFGSDSSGNEFDPAEAAEEEEADVHNEEGTNVGAGSIGGGGADVLEDSDNIDDDNNIALPTSAFEPATGGTGLSDSEDEEPQQQSSAAEAAKRADADVFGTDREDDVAAPARGVAGVGGGGSAAAGGGFDPFEDSDDDVDQGGESGAQEGKTLRGGGGGRLSKGGISGTGKGKKRKAGADGSSSKKKSKSKSHGDRDGSTKKKKKRKRKDGEDGGEEEDSGKKKKKRGKKKKSKKKKAKTSVENSTLHDLGLASSADEAADEDDEDDMSDEEVEHEDEAEEVSGEETAGAGAVRTRDDDDFIDNSVSNATS